jgi:hypothetical protein
VAEGPGPRASPPAASAAGPRPRKAPERSSTRIRSESAWFGAFRKPLSGTRACERAGERCAAARRGDLSMPALAWEEHARDPRPIDDMTNSS